MSNVMGFETFENPFPFPQVTVILGKNDTCKTAAVPAFFTDLYKKNNANLGNRLVQNIKLHLAVSRHFILLISFMEFEYCVRAESILCNNTGYQRIDHFL